MVRAASKITISVKIPEWIEVTEITGDSSEGNTTTTPTTVKYYPHLENDSEGKIPLRTAFHHGVSKTYLNNDYNSQLVEGDYFSSPMTAYKNLVFTAGADANTAGYYTCEIEVPFYSYARTWAKGDVDAPYLTLQMPWKKTVDGEDVLFHDVFLSAFWQLRRSQPLFLFSRGFVFLCSLWPYYIANTQENEGVNTHLIRRAIEVYFSKNRNKKMFKSSSNLVKTEEKAISFLLKMCYNMSAGWTRKGRQASLLTSRKS